MRLRFLRLALPLIACLAVAVPVSASEEEHEHTELEEKMDKMNASWRKLRRQVSNPEQNASSLELVAAIRKASEGAEKLTPAKVAEMPESERAAAQAAYEAEMKKFHEKLDALEAALKAGDNPAASKVLTEIADHQRESHKAFRKPPPEKQG